MIDIPLPGNEGRRKMFDINLKDLKLASSINWDKLVEITKGCSGADICNICRDAAYMPMRKKLLQVGGIAKIS
jgi:katanin p60 ATPase-containing subunit A1